MSRGVIYEEVSIYRQSDSSHSQASRSRNAGCRSLPRIRYEQRQFYQWRSKYGGMDASLMRRLKELEAENARLKKMYAEERIKSELRQEALEGKL